MHEVQTQKYFYSKPFKIAKHYTFIKSKKLNNYRNKLAVI